MDGFEFRDRLATIRSLVGGRQQRREPGSPPGRGAPQAPLIPPRRSAVARGCTGIRGGDIDSKGVVWGSGSSGHLVSFDRSKCNAPLNGPNATGDHCPEGWAFYKYPGPGFDGFPNTSAETSYYTWVDQHNTLGLGNDVPISTANLEDGFVAFKDGNMVL